jgi:hypothetical protein
MLVAVGACASSAAAASGVDIWVGYADTVRANPANFPTPFTGSGIQTFSRSDCTTSGSPHCDSGAVRLVNNSASAVTVNSLVVKMSTCTMDFWPHNVVVPVGGQIVVADTGTTTVPPGCPATSPPGFQFDTSDIGPNGADWSFNCTQSGIIPQVTATIDGVGTTADDTGQVLNTGGVDKAFCAVPGQQVNESTQWTKIGNAPCAGATLSLAPPSQTHRVGETAAVTGTLANGCGQGLQGATVHFAVDFGGPNSGKTGSATTDVNGKATFSYVGTGGTGTDGVQAFVTNPAGTILSNIVTVKWTAPITYTGRASAANFSLFGGARQFISDTGEISTPLATDTPRSVLNLPGPVISASVLAADVKTKTGTPLGANATASAANVNVALPGAPVIHADVVTSSSTSNCTGASGSSTIAGLKIGGLPVTVAPGVNSKITVGPLTITFNEQQPVAGADHGLLVNAIHINLPGVADVVLASSRSDIHNC